MEKPIHAINWFKIPALDFNLTKTFYSNLYAYEMEVMEMGREKMGTQSMKCNSFENYNL